MSEKAFTPLCPDCGEPMEQRRVGRKIRWLCRNPVCSVIFTEKKLIIARDPSMINYRSGIR